MQRHASIWELAEATRCNFGPAQQAIVEMGSPSPGLPALVDRRREHRVPSAQARTDRRSWGRKVPTPTEAASCDLVTLGAAVADGSDGRSPGRTRDSLGANVAMGGVGTHALAVLDGVFTGPDRDGPYDYPHNDRSVLRQPSGHTR